MRRRAFRLDEGGLQKINIEKMDEGKRKKRRIA